MDTNHSVVSECAAETPGISDCCVLEMPAQPSLGSQLEFRNTKRLSGANRWSLRPVLEADLNLSALRHEPATWQALLDGLQTRNATSSAQGTVTLGLAQVALAIVHLAADLQQSACRAVDAPCVEQLSDPEEFRLVLPCEEFVLAEQALHTALSAAQKLVRGEPWDPEPSLLQLYEVAERCCLGPSTFAICSAARQRSIPVDRWGDNSLLRLGQGQRQRRMWTGVSDQTNSLADSIVKDKELTRQLLGSCGIPVPVGRPVESPTDAWRTACELGLPVVVKPRDGNHSRGVCLNLKSRSQIDTAYGEAVLEGPVMVESMVPGQEHRVLVVGDRVIAAAVRQPAQVLGDGQHSVAQLVQIANRDSRRGQSPFSPMHPLVIDDVAAALLAEQDLRIDSIPQEAQRVLLRRIASIARGGTCRDVTASVHPAVAATCVAAAGIVGLDIAGIDVVALDLSQPLSVQGGAIVEVNAGPGLSMHLNPWPAPESVGEAILDYLFPVATSQSRIPIIAVRGRLVPTLCPQLSTALQRELHHFGLVCSAGSFLNSQKLVEANLSIAENVRRLLWHPQLQALVFEAVDEQILQTGLGVDQLDWLIDSPLSNSTADGKVAHRLKSLLPDRTHYIDVAANELAEIQIQHICQSVGCTVFGRS